MTNHHCHNHRVCCPMSLILLQSMQSRTRHLLHRKRSRTPSATVSLVRCPCAIIRYVAPSDTPAPALCSGAHIDTAITARRWARPPSTPGAGAGDAQSIKVLPSMTMRTLRMKLAKTFKLTKAEQAGVRMWLRMPDGAYAEVDLTDDNHQLDWWGLEDGSEIAVAALQS